MNLIPLINGWKYSIHTGENISTNRLSRLIPRSTMSQNIVERGQIIYRSMRTLEFITGRVVYNPAYNWILQLKATLVKKD